MPVNVFVSAPGHDLAMIRRILFLMVLAMLTVATPAIAVSTVDCHCFRDREFSPQNPAAYDPYLLATVQNRLLAHAFNIPRKEIVSMKMAGGQGDELWVSHWVAQASGRQVAEVRTVFAKTMSWNKTVAELSVKPEKLGGPFLAVLGKHDDTGLAWAVVEQVSGKYTSHPEALSVLKKRGASLKEAILASILAELKDEAAVSQYALAVEVGNWGSLLVSSNITVESIETFLEKNFSSR